MSLTSGTRSAASEALSWGAAGAILIAGFVFLDDLKALFMPPPPSAETARAYPPRANSTGGATAARRQAPAGSGYKVVLEAGRYGHFKTTARINASPIEVLVDTGASYVALTWEDAERAGIFVDNSDFKHRTQTANGFSRVALVTIDRIAIGNIEVRGVRASVHERGKLGITLLGMSFLGKLRRAEMQAGRMIMEN